MKIAYFLDATSVIGGAGNVLLEQAKIMSSLHEIVIVIPLDRWGKMNPEYMHRCKKADIRYVGLVYTTSFCIQYIDIVKAWKDVEKIEESFMRLNAILWCMERKSRSHNPLY